MAKPMAVTTTATTIIAPMMYVVGMPELGAATVSVVVTTCTLLAEVVTTIVCVEK